MGEREDGALVVLQAAAQDDEVLRHDGQRIRPLHLDRDRLPAEQPPLVHLRQRGCGDVDWVQLREDLAHWAAQLHLDGLQMAQRQAALSGRWRQAS